MNWDDFRESLPLWSSLGICFALMAAEVLRLRQRIRGTQDIASGGTGNAQHNNSQTAGPGGRMPASREQLSQ
jgi:hypothetical protein